MIQLKKHDSIGSKTKELWKNPEYRKMMSEAHKGNKGFWKGRKLTPEAKEKMRQAKLKNPTKYWLGKECPHMAGKNNRGYIDGRGKTRRGTNTHEYVGWRTGVFIRDNWTCQTCGVRGKKLEAHHIKGWSEFIDLRFDIDNGVTLCVSCHKLTDNYGRKNKKSKRKDTVITPQR